MSDDERFQAWLDKVCARPLPQNAMARIRTLAKELAEGASENLWDTKITYAWEKNGMYGNYNQNIYSLETVNTYLQTRWNSYYPKWELLQTIGYVEWIDGGIRLLEAAFDLLQETEPTNIFISYKRSESSAFALLIHKYLKVEGLNTFLDLALEAGEDWHAGLKERIQQYDYLVLLVGKETLKSDVVIQEIQWALEAGLSLIPVWHGGFKYQSAEWTLPPEIDQKLANTHAIEVKEESALGYDTAITELLNRFGITP